MSNLPRNTLSLVLLGLAPVLIGQPPFRLEEATIPYLQAAFEAGTLTSEELVLLYLDRIEAYDKKGPALSSIIAIHPEALATARALDLERQATGPRGPLHGIPILLKDDFDTFDMPTTAGSVSLETSIPPDDAFIVRRLRDAGAIILGKTNMDEFLTSGIGLSSLGGQTLNPYDTRRIPGGSSAGTAAAIAANLAAVGLGTDTFDSIRRPAFFCGLVGIRPTLGLVSRDGIIPLTLYKDTGGPMTRTVTDAAILLDVMAGFDPADKATEASAGQVPASYTDFLDADGLRGARIGIVRLIDPGADPEVVSLVRAAAAEMARAGVVLLDPLDITVVRNLLIQDFDSLWFLTSEHDLNRYLESLGPASPFHSVRQIISSGKLPPAVAVVLLSRLRGDIPPEKDPEFPAFVAATMKLRTALSVLMDKENLDAILYPSVPQAASLVGAGFQGDNYERLLSPFTGFPAIVVPAGFTRSGLPVGIELIGRPFSEPTLIRLAYAYEQATQHRRPPASTPPLDCNQNGQPDGLDLLRHLSEDCNANRTPDECETDCNRNGVPDDCDLAAGLSLDCDGDGIPNECEPDCNQNGLPDPCEVLDGERPDCNSNLQPDECEVTIDTGEDCKHFFTEDVGQVGIPGSARTVNGCLSVVGAEGSISLHADRFLFAHQKVAGDFELRARIEAWSADRQGSRLGLMIRESLDAGARHGSVVLERLLAGGFRHRFLRREATGGFTLSATGIVYDRLGLWLRLERRGDLISGMLSTDGESWTPADTVQVPQLPLKVYFGIASSYPAGGPPLATVCGLTLAVIPPPQFHRGDPNASGAMDLSDGVFIFAFLFLGGPTPACLESADAQNDGKIDLSDGISILNHLFLGGPPPATPGPPDASCGTDPDAVRSPGDLGCESYDHCVLPN